MHLREMENPPVRIFKWRGDPAELDEFLKTNADRVGPLNDSDIYDLVSMGQMRGPEVLVDPLRINKRKSGPVGCASSSSSSSTTTTSSSSSSSSSSSWSSSSSAASSSVAALKSGEEGWPNTIRRFSPRTVQKWHVEAVLGGGFFTEESRGQHAKVKWLLEDSKLRTRFEDYVLKNGNKKGERNMSALDLEKFVNNDLFKVCIHLVFLFLLR